MAAFSLLVYQSELPNPGSPRSSRATHVNELGASCVQQDGELHLLSVGHRQHRHALLQQQSDQGMISRQRRHITAASEVPAHWAQLAAAPSALIALPAAPGGGCWAARCCRSPCSQRRACCTSKGGERAGLVAAAAAAVAAAGPPRGAQVCERRCA